MQNNLTNQDLLINKCINGDKRYQKKLYDLYSKEMFLVCLKYSKNEADAQDLLQEGFIKLFLNLHRYRREGSFEGWIKRIFINTACTYVKKQVTIEEMNKFENKVIAKDQSGFDNLCEKELIKITRTLSPGFRTVFKLYAIEGYSHKEIGLHLGITEGTSKSQLSRAKVLLRNLIESEFATPDLGIAV